jgi:hypothetical protein
LSRIEIIGGNTQSTKQKLLSRFSRRAGGRACAPVRRKVKRILRRHWDQITKVAVLAERGELTGDESDRSID